MNRKYLYPVIVFVIIVILWEFLVALFGIREFILPSPSAIVVHLIDSAHSIAYHFCVTMSEAVLGFLTAVLIGVPIAVLFNCSKFAEWSFYPYIVALKVTPIIAMVPFLILWFGVGPVSKIIAAAIMAIFPIVVDTTRGLREIRPECLEMMKSFSATKRQTFMKLKLPNSIPYLFSGLKIATALSTVGAVVAEFVGSNEGLGFLILTHFYYLETATMFASLIALSAGGIVFFFIVSLIESKLLQKYGIGVEE